jgi:hypothetical protein
VGGGFFVGDAVMAGLCAFICPGLGHLILGKPFQALIWFVLIVVGYFMFIVPGIILHIISIVDAARAGRQDQISAMATAIKQSQR